MSSMYLGINDNCTINNYGQFVRRYNHNNRKKNLGKNYKFSNDNFINVVEDFFEDSKKIIRDFNKNNDNNLSKSEVIKKIHKVKSKIKLYENDKNVLFEQIKPFLHSKDSKEYILLDNKIQRKLKALNHQKEYLFELEKIHNNLEDKNKYARKQFHEIVFEITSLPKYLLRNKQNEKNISLYGKDLLLFFKEQIKENFPNMNITLIALHCDQNGMPHIHLNGFYTTSSMSNDLTLKYGKEKQFEQLQQSFFLNLQKSPLLHKHGIKLDDLKQNEIYIPLQDLKLIDTWATQKTNKILKNIEEHTPFWGAKDFQIENLKKVVFKYCKEQIKQQKQLNIAKTKYMGDKNLIKKYELELETTQNNLDKVLNPYLLEIETLKQKNIQVVQGAKTINENYKKLGNSYNLLINEYKKEKKDKDYYENKYNEIYKELEELKNKLDIDR